MSVPWTFDPCHLLARHLPEGRRLRLALHAPPWGAAHAPVAAGSQVVAAFHPPVAAGHWQASPLFLVLEVAFLASFSVPIGPSPILWGRWSVGTPQLALVLLHLHLNSMTRRCKTLLSLLHHRRHHLQVEEEELPSASWPVGLPSSGLYCSSFHLMSEVAALPAPDPSALAAAPAALRDQQPLCRRLCSRTHLEAMPFRICHIPNLHPSDTLSIPLARDGMHWPLPSWVALPPSSLALMAPESQLLPLASS